MMPDPERLGLESASTAYRRRRCTGSANLVRALREQGKLEERSNPDAESGTRVHKAWSGEEVALNPREADTLESLKRMEAMLVADWAGNDDAVLFGREQRLWLHQHLEPIHSGQFDVAYGTVRTNRMLIMDGKTLFAEVSPAEENDQLRELVGLARANFKHCREFTVAILQPWVSQRPSVAVYDEIEAELALRQLRETIRDNADPDAPRIAGAWCPKCPAFTFCDEAKGITTRTHDLAKEIYEGKFALPVGEKGTQLLNGIDLAKDLLESIKDRYKALLEAEPDAIPGWYLKPGRIKRRIPNVSRAMAIAEDFIPMADFNAALSISITALEEVCKKASGGLRGKALDNYVETNFGSVIERITEQPTLARKTEKTLSP